MLTLFLRAVFLYLFVFLVLRLTGKRQVSDLQPFDLLITLLIADLAGCALSEPGVPLLYSVVPILGLYLSQQLITWLCLKSARTRRAICGSPVVIMADGLMLESNMRMTNYTVLDVMDQLRSKSIFDLREVAYAILETNGSMSVLLKSGFQQPSRDDLGVASAPAGLSHMLVLDGQVCQSELDQLGIDKDWLCARTREQGMHNLSELLFFQYGADGSVVMQRKEKQRVS